ncbi:hypothetical protein [Chitinimonas sp. BJB300]|uniref:hypothetical protein n=1 Tax=Chitinimonas sp. BJB300 TaxID=1559339 RepID=UPI000C10E8B2|nr:hypothetical protein [Chitinimonas sp. BJB300]PHV10197.1 hypothetical protein CSQ89_17530 [Chitinimonas sp. BJB300]TSJ84564.1 hypothetical protein FG002_019730 [Chitinimonas sp. BJB300]
MKTTVSVLSAMTALDNEPRLMMAMRLLLSNIALQGERSSAYCDGLARFTHIVNTRYGTEAFSVEDESIGNDPRQAAACLTVTEASSINVRSVTFLSPRIGEAVARQAITLVRRTGEPITIHADRTALGELFTPV